jgi:hypothetical protein
MKGNIKSLLERYGNINKKISQNKGKIREMNERYKNSCSIVKSDNEGEMYLELYNNIRNHNRNIFSNILKKMEENKCEYELTDTNKSKYLLLKESCEEVINEENEKINKINNRLKEKMKLLTEEIYNLYDVESNEFKSILNKAILCEYTSKTELEQLEYYYYLINDLVEIKLIGNDLEYKLLSNGEILNHYQMVRYLIKKINPVCMVLKDYINLYQLYQKTFDIESTEQFLLKLKYVVC